jgi:hypothetical protein
MSRLAQLERGDSQGSSGDATPPRKPRRFGAPSPKETIADVAANDPSVTKVDFTGNASFQVRPGSPWPQCQGRKRTARDLGPRDVQRRPPGTGCAERMSNEWVALATSGVESLAQLHQLTN